MLKLLATGACALVLIATAAAAPAAPTLTVTPNPAAAYSPYTISGCGYRPGSYVEVTIDRALGFGIQEIGESGCLEPLTWRSGPGTYLVEAKKYPACGSGAHGHSAGAKCGLLAEVVLVVEQEA